MTNNEILLMIQNILDLNDITMVEIYNSGKSDMKSMNFSGFLKNEGEAGYTTCPDSELLSFLEGLIVFKRGPRENTLIAEHAPMPVTNNLILKKLRIAFNLKEEDLLNLLKKAGAEISKNELGAFFRKENNKHFKKCSDLLLGKFLDGLAKVTDH